MSAYRPPLEGRDPNNHLLLDFNERTAPLPPELLSWIRDYLEHGSLQTYPAYGDAVSKFAEYFNVKPPQLMLTNGSDQAIDLVIRACCEAGKEAIIPAPSFPMYTQSSLVEGLKIIEPEYSKESGFPIQQVLDAISDKTGLIVLPNPNNPTGTGIERDQILAILERPSRAAVLVDECYFEYTGETVVDCAEQYPNLFVTRTFSKTWGLPALRLGALISDASNIDHLLKVRGPYDVNKLAVVAATAAIESPGYMTSYVDEVMKIAKPKLEGFLLENGIEFFPSVANFILAFPENPEVVEQMLREQGILVRPKRDAQGRPGLRITVGTTEQVERLISVLYSKR